VQENGQPAVLLAGWPAVHEKQLLYPVPPSRPQARKGVQRAEPFGARGRGAGVQRAEPLGARGRGAGVQRAEPFGARGRGELFTEFYYRDTHFSFAVYSVAYRLAALVPL